MFLPVLTLCLLFTQLKSCSIAVPTTNYISNVQLLKEDSSSVLLTISNINRTKLPEDFCVIYSLDSQTITQCVDCNSRLIYDYALSTTQDIERVGIVRSSNTQYSMTYVYDSNSYTFT